ncbi:hypothetical protein EPI10_020883 [Gossypium australe]|uniref:Uncharacterized protein n=1 Tax=Gossypium australe TaxID=47621 RepID=A0A5B6WH66_9ROSI|nr:hypothetical protein EPI10_020883 [Gossypium australe]
MPHGRVVIRVVGRVQGCEPQHGRVIDEPGRVIDEPSRARVTRPCDGSARQCNPHEPQCISKPPNFNGENYLYWKTRMVSFCFNAKEIWDKLKVIHEKQEEAYFSLMAIKNSKATSNLSTSNSYSFDELQDGYDELGLEVPKGLSTTQDNDILSKWIPKGTRILETNAYGPKRI